MNDAVYLATTLPVYRQVKRKGWELDARSSHTIQTASQLAWLVNHNACSAYNYLLIVQVVLLAGYHRATYSDIAGIAPHHETNVQPERNL